MKIKIITDSTSDIPKGLSSELGIEIVPLTVNFGDLSYKDQIDLTSEEFFEKLGESDVMPTTSQVSIGEFVEIFESNLKEYDELIVINLSSELSGTYNAAVQAKDTIASEHIHVIDSRLVSFAMGLVVVEAAKKIKMGQTLDEVIDYVSNAYKNMENIFIFDTLEYLLKGGRLSKNEAFLGNLLNIKPILTITDGFLKSKDKIRGRKKAVKYANKKIKADYEQRPFKKIAIFESADSEMKSEIVKFVSDEISGVEILESKIGIVVGTHSGPGCAAITYIYE